MIKKIHIIAEAGTNHNGHFDKAKELVDVAVKALADSVKFQIIYPEGLYLPKLFKNGEYHNNEVFQKRQSMMLKDEDYRKIAEYCEEKGIKFSASVFDRRGIDLLEELNASYIKIASCDLNNSRLLKMAAERGRCLVVSTGMASLGEIEKAVSDICSTGNPEIVLMHCVSVYPCPTERMNLGFLGVLKSAFGFPVGLSDHTESSLAGAMAIALEAEWIEKHFTLNRQWEGFDHGYAMETNQFIAFVKDMRCAEGAISFQGQKIGSEEKTVKERARRSIYAARDIPEGKILKEEDICIVRPEAHLSPNDLPSILGKPANRFIRQFEPITINLFR